MSEPDLVERLRKTSMKDQWAVQLMDDAADEIERLRQRIEAAIAWLVKHDDELELIRILRGEEKP